MTTTPTEAEIAAIREREKKATPGPWVYERDDEGQFSAVHPVLKEHMGDVTDNCTFADYEFIAHAREDVPRLLAAVDVLKAELLSLQHRKSWREAQVEAAEAALAAQTERCAELKFALGDVKFALALGGVPELMRERALEIVNAALAAITSTSATPEQGTTKSVDVSSPLVAATPEQGRGKSCPNCAFPMTHYRDVFVTGEREGWDCNRCGHNVFAPEHGREEEEA